MIVSDRVELNRYCDFPLWKKGNFSHEQKFTVEQKAYLRIFYDVVRPAIQYFFENRKGLFLRHGLECKFSNAYNDEITSYPATYFKHLAVDLHGNYFEDNFAIEIDKFPFINCCNHSADAIWTYIQGLIKIDDVKFPKFGYWIKTEEESIHDIHFDHMVAQFASNLNEWKFIHRLEILLDYPEAENMPTDKDLEFLLKNKNNIVLGRNLSLLEINVFNMSKFLTVFQKANNVQR